MGEKTDMNCVPDRSVETYVVAKTWWREDDDRLLPGEEGGTTTFVVEFQDGCRYVGYTRGSVFDRLGELMGSGFNPRSNYSVREHSQRMAYVVWCVASGLDRSRARELRDRLVSEAPGDVYVADATTLKACGCWLNEEAAEVEVMTFAEWANSQFADARTGDS